MSKERPILFSSPMVKALLEGRKTQTRRIVKPRKDVTFGCLLYPNELAGEVNNGVMDNCPWPPGNRLWVRERCELTLEECEVGCLNIRYLADGTLRDVGTLPGDTPGIVNWINGRWSRPSIHMPRWASRITLEIVSVRAELLQEISETDALSEGLAEITKDGRIVKYGIADFDGLPGTDNTGWPWHEWSRSPVDSYRKLWESINGRGSWNENPWVWVINFGLV